MPQQNQFGRTESFDLPAEFTPDRPARAGHEHLCPGQEKHDLCSISFNHPSAEEIFQLYAADIIDAGGPTNDVVQRGNGLARHFHLAAKLDHLPDDFPGRCRHCDDHFINVVLFHQVGNVAEATQYRYTVDTLADFARIIIHKPNRHVSQMQSCAEAL